MGIDRINPLTLVLIMLAISIIFNIPPFGDGGLFGAPAPLDNITVENATPTGNSTGTYLNDTVAEYEPRKNDSEDVGVFELGNLLD